MESPKANPSGSESKNQINDEADSLDSALNSEKQQQNEQERLEILASVSSSRIRTTKEKVAYILNRSTVARNSDIDLAWEYWATFESDRFNSQSVTKEILRSLTSLASLSRARAKIQNEYELYLADDEVRKFRGTLKVDIKKEAIEDKPKDLKLYSVYVDETGKNDNFLSVGSLWLLDAGASVLGGQLEMDDWKKSKNISNEFHFTKASKNQLEIYMEFFDRFLHRFPTIGFKSIVIQNKGIAKIGDAIIDLTYHLISKGIAHEEETKRAPLPRMLQVWIDEEEKGSDSLKLENIKERLTSQKINGLYLDQFEAVPSKNNYFIQMTDLFAGAINRKLNSGATGHFKDDLADFILRATGFDADDFDRNNTEIDNAKVFNLR